MTVIASEARTGSFATVEAPRFRAQSLPLTVAMVLLLLSAAIILRLNPGDVNAIVAWTSTNTHNLAHHPAAALLLSAFVVPGSLLPNLAIVAISLAVLERAVGTRRTALVAVAGQVVATLFTEYGAALGAHWQLLGPASAQREDVGVSYVMYAVLAAAVLTLPARIQLPGLIVVGIAVLGPFVAEPGMTSAGHVLSVAVGAAVMVAIRRGARPALV